MAAGIRLGAAMSALLIASAGAACAGDSPPASRPEGQPPLKLVPKLARQDLLRGRSTRVAFYVQEGEPIPKRARLEADPYPFGRYRKVSAKRFDSAAEVALRVKPERTTRYRIVAGGAESSPQTVYVDTFGRLEAPATTSGVQGVRYEIDLPKGLEPRLQSVYFYYSPNVRAKRVSRVDSAPLRRDGGGRLSATGSTRATPPAGSRILVAACTKKPVTAGFGGSAIQHRVCGRRTLPRKAVNFRR